MYSYVACRVCLVTDKPFKTFECDPWIRDAYLSLVGIVDYNPLQTVCLECSALLRKCLQLRQKCMRANMVLKNIMVTTFGQITYDTIKEVDRKINNLDTNLSIGNYNNIDIQSEVIDKNCTPVKVEKNEENSLWNLVESNIVQYEPDNINLFAKEENMTIIKEEPEFEVPVVENNDMDWDGEDDLNVQKEIKEITKVKRKVKRKKTSDEASPKIKIKNELQYDIDLIKEYAEIMSLTPEMAKQDMLSRKETNNYKSSAFKCNMCFKGFGVQVAFNNHMRKHSSEFGEFECDICFLRCTDRRTFLRHFNDCHKTKFKCKLCPFQCFGLKGIALHVAIHKGKKFDCNMCNESYSTRSSLEAHKRKTHPREFVCGLCGKTYSTQRGLTLHKGLLHRKEQNEKRGPFCSECNIHFANETAWKRHLVLSSKHETSNGCEYCGETFNDSFELRKHLRVHAGTHYNRQVFKVPSKCLKCDKHIENKTDYNRHMKTEHPSARSTKKLENNDSEQHICELCGKIYKQRILLVYHMRVHTGEKPYKCNVCGKEFMFSSGFCLHKQTHSEERVHCDVCGKSFGTKNTLVKHLKLHSGIRPYKCQFCGKAYINRCEVQRHAKYVHYKVPWPKRDKTKKAYKDNKDGADCSIIK